MSLGEWLDGIGRPVQRFVEGLGRPVQSFVENLGEATAEIVERPAVRQVAAFQPDIKYVEIPPGEKGTVATLKIMKDLVLGPWGAYSPNVALLANQIRDRYPSKNYEAEAEGIFRAVKDGLPGVLQAVKYKLDPAGLEWVQTPVFTLFERHAGDCDDHAGAVAALALASGFRAAFRTVRGDMARPDEWSHVYAVIGVTRKGQTHWYAADSTQSQASLGWDPPEALERGMKTWILDPTVR